MQVTVTTVRYDHDAEKEVFKVETFFSVIDVPKTEGGMLVIRRTGTGGKEVQTWIPTHRIHEVEVTI